MDSELGVRDRNSIDQNRNSIDRNRSSIDRNRNSIDRNRNSIDRNRSSIDRNRNSQDGKRVWFGRISLVLGRKSAEAAGNPGPADCLARSSQAGRARLSTALVAFVVLAVAASALVLVRGRAAGSRFPRPASLSKIFGAKPAPAERLALTPLNPPTNLVVTKTDDTDDHVCSLTDCSLREAIFAANSNPDTNTITFNIPTNTDPGCVSVSGPCTITLSVNQLATNTNMNINGPTAYGVVVSGGVVVRVLNVQAGDASISNLTISDGEMPLGGGLGTSVGANLTVTNCTISGNHASNGGGGINNDGTLTVINSTISDNSSSGGGAGIRNRGTLTLVNSTISGNFADRKGGGLLNDSNGGTGIALITNTTITNNSANYDDSDGCDTSPCDGGGIYNNGPTVTLRNTIVAGNFYGSSPGAAANDITGNNVDTANSSYNLIGTGSGGLSDGVNGNQVGIFDPRLGPLANNGGPTETIELLPGSPAIEAGDDCVLTLNGCSGGNPAVATDQRGVTRPQGKHVDIGAFELQAYFVTKTDDTNGTCLPGDCSLREAITAANLDAPNVRMILFKIPSGDLGCDVNAVCTITPSPGALPPIYNTVFIDGYSQPGWKQNSLDLDAGDDAVLKIQLSGTGLPAGSLGLDLHYGSEWSVVRGLIINNFSGAGVWLENEGSNQISGNFIGTNAAGTAAAANGDGVAIIYGLYNLIGGDLPAERNVISGNRTNGIRITSDEATDNSVEGNYIGTTKNGDVALANLVGVYVNDASSGNVIGCEVLNGDNLISGNTTAGVRIEQSLFNYVQGNFIGTDKTGMAAIPNDTGIDLKDAPINSVGLPDFGNLISGNTGAGLLLQSSPSSNFPSSGNEIQGNRIGTDVSGTVALANNVGILIRDSSSNIIGGGTIRGDRNYISGNTLEGIRIEVSSPTGVSDSNQIFGNFIGTDVTGTAAIPNIGSGVKIIGGFQNEVGCTFSGSGNLISGNTGEGVELTGGAGQNFVQGNFIGVQSDESSDLGNGGAGVEIYSLPTQPSTDNVVGVMPGGGNQRAPTDSIAAKSGPCRAQPERNTLRETSARAIRQARQKTEGTRADSAATMRAAVIRPPRPTLKAKRIPQDRFAARTPSLTSSAKQATRVGPTIAPPTVTVDGGNVIAYNVGDGIKISSAGDVNNLISQNSIYSNGKLGINLVGATDPTMGPQEGVTGNDSGDGDDGPNHLQNFPLITDAAADTQKISGTLDSSMSGQPYTVEFFVNDVNEGCDGSGNGEGKSFIGFTTTNAGNFSFTAAAGSFTTGQTITATATDAAGNTSEFSACFTATTPAPEIAVEQPSGSDRSDGSSTVDFGQQNVGTTSAAKTFIIKNVGTADLTLGAISKNGTDAGDFTVDTSGMSGTVTPGNSTTFTVTFTPGAAGLRHAAIHIANNDSSENPFDIALAGTTCPPPTLGNYPDKSLPLSSDAMVSPSPLPTNVSRLIVTTSTDFKGKLEGYPSSGVVRITDAHPAGAYTVTVTAFDACGATTTRTFTLTVTTPQTCNPVKFATAVNHSTGTQPVSVAIGDFDGDGKQDLAVANSNSGADGPGYLRVLLGNGAGGFSPVLTDFTVGTTPLSVVVGDFNGDGKEDLAVANANSNNISVLLGNGSGGFGAAANFDVGLAPISLAVGDFDGDGRPDLATANRDSDNVSVLLGNGAGSFGTAANFSVGSKPQSIAVGDFNHDGKQDLVTGNVNSDNISVLVGDGAGSFGGPTNYDVGDSPYSVAIGDFTGDGIQDLVAGNYDSDNVSILVNDGSGGFGSATNLPVGHNPLSIAIGDFDGDTRQDLLIVNQGADSVSVLAGNGSGGFAAAGSFPVGSKPRSAAVGDFNGDGQQDLAVANQLSDNASVLLRQCTPTAANGSVAGQILDGNGHPVEGAGIRMSGTQTRMTVTDRNGNYHFDEVETNGFYTVVPSRANYTFSPAQRSFSALGQQTDAAFNASVTSDSLNPLDTTEYFVRQQYLDFLGREPDEAGLNFWYRNIESCGDNVDCRAARRIDTSAAFFLSIEFQQTGYLVYRTYRTAFGDIPGAPVPLNLNEFKPDTAAIGNGVIVNKTGWETQLDSNKQAYMAEFVLRPRFTTAYPLTLTPVEFVDQLFATAGVSASTEARSAAIAEFGSQATSSDVAARGRALRRIAENSVLTQREFNQAFVLMQYFGYLRRDANAGQDTDFSGYDFWLDKLNTFHGNFGDAQMVKAFLVSGEYRGRFPR